MLNQVLEVSDFVALVNQTLDYAYPEVMIEGEVSGFSLNQDKFVFFDLKDSSASVGCFMMVFQLKVPLEDGMRVRITAQPKLTNKGRFSLTVRQVVPVGEGGLKRAFELLRAKLDREGLFAPERKRPLPPVPDAIGLISSESAAGAKDFLTILGRRWGGVEVKFARVQVQGESAPDQIVKAVDYFNQLARPVDVLAIVRGGGSLEDLWAFNTEPVARAIAASRSPVITGIGHQDDVTLADLAADVRAATPTDAAALVVPDRRQILSQLESARGQLARHIQHLIVGRRDRYLAELRDGMNRVLSSFEQNLSGYRRSLMAYDPEAALRRGYSVLSKNGRVMTSVRGLKAGDTIKAKLSDGQLTGEVTSVHSQN